MRQGIDLLLVENQVRSVSLSLCLCVALSFSLWLPVDRSRLSVCVSVCLLCVSPSVYLSVCLQSHKAWVAMPKRHLPAAAERGRKTAKSEERTDTRGLSFLSLPTYLPTYLPRSRLTLCVPVGQDRCGRGHRSTTLLCQHTMIWRSVCQQRWGAPHRRQHSAPMRPRLQLYSGVAEKNAGKESSS